MISTTLFPHAHAHADDDDDDNDDGADVVDVDPLMLMSLLSMISSQLDWYIVEAFYFLWAILIKSAKKQGVIE